ncbi:MAG: PTS sugar transporter subunit IIA [Coriobacteriaceae bacterium]|nr:MAG: PTS sugar transporter subunit IIA [Coriobacteriaceae bacterium]
MSRLITAKNVFLHVKAQNVDEVLAFLSQKAKELGYASDDQEVLRSFKEREALDSTGMADGFALPHAKTDAISEEAVLVAKLDNDVDWKTRDKVPIRVAIAILTPGKFIGTKHLVVLSKIASMLMGKSTRDQIINSGDPDEIAKIISDVIDEN